ncbi:MAG TPA: SpoIID/LytB domain-containing protein [Candidatus Saccharimonadales bacterium]|nr:SpoIID/LytB domain-containing protein [Candidatus Saccharimonadales bacterium]
MPMLARRLPIRHLAAVLALALVVGGVAAAPPPVRAADPVPTPIGDTVTFYGRGYGHGVGMNQHGARGRALAGQTSTQILAKYYQGATLGKIDLATPIRVQVLTDFKATSTTPLELYARLRDWTMTGTEIVFPPDARITVTPTVTTASDGTKTTTWRVTVKSAAGTTLHTRITAGFRMTPVSGAGRIQVWSRTSTKDEYRGTIRVRLSTVARVVNEVSLETYLRGVVPAEMPSSWPTQALKAQAIAARSYAARHLRPGVSDYDVRDDTSSQVYLGSEGEKATTDAVISSTAGVVLKSGTAVANTLFHSTGGGATEHNENVYVSSTGKKLAGPVSYLRGSMDRRSDGSAWDEDAPYATWKTKTYSKTQLSAWFAADTRTNVGTISAIDLSHRGVSGRLISVTLIGSKGSKTVSGGVFRSVFNEGRPSADPSMRSTLVNTKFVP